MMGIDWRESMTVGVKEIDDQHKKLIETMEKLNEAIIKHEVDENLTQTFDGLFEYMNIHLATEEAYFDQFHYPEAAEHKAAHDFFRKRIGEMHNNIDKNIRELSIELVSFLEFWLVGHIMIMDQRYVQCFHENGLK
jgi:hemerythrin-like metal-binding protein